VLSSAFNGPPSLPSLPPSLPSTGIYDYGFEKPSAIQQRAVLPIIKGYDIIAQSQSGTGKTAVFSMGILQRLDTTSNDTQVRLFLALYLYL